MKMTINVSILENVRTIQVQFLYISNFLQKKTNILLIMCICFFFILPFKSKSLVAQRSFPRTLGLVFYNVISFNIFFPNNFDEFAFFCKKSNIYLNCKMVESLNWLLIWQVNKISKSSNRS